MSISLVGIVMGSDSDYPTMEAAEKICREFGVSFETKVLSAHRTPKEMAEYASQAHERGLKVIIAGAGGAAHLPGMVAAYTPLPVIGVPVQSKSLQGMDSLLSIVQMPRGIPVATVAIGGAENAAILAIQILSVQDVKLVNAMLSFREKMVKSLRVAAEEIESES